MSKKGWSNVQHAMRLKDKHIAQLERSREQLDCRYAGSHWESSGSHCPIDKPCMRCAMQARLDAVKNIMHDMVCEDDWCGKSPTKNDPGLCPTCRMKQALGGDDELE